MVSQLLRLEGQRVLVVGGSSGIGRATAEIATQAGARVAIAARSEERLLRAAAEIGGATETLVADILDDVSIASLFDRREWDHVVVTASAVRIAPVREIPLETALASFDSKFWGFYRIARHANIRAGGSLGVVTGYLATRPVAGRALMSAINAALEALTRGLALEMKPVRVNAVSPGLVATEMWAGMPEAEREALFSRTAAAYPAGVIGQPEDVAAQLLLLASSPYATGTVVTLDGGASLI